MVGKDIVNKEWYPESSYMYYTTNIYNQSATVVQLILAIIATFSFYNVWLQSLQISGCKVKVHLLDENIASITCCT